MSTVELTAKDCHRLAAYRAEPKGKPRGGLVIIQEFFGKSTDTSAGCAINTPMMAIWCSPATSIASSATSSLVTTKSA